MPEEILNYVAPIAVIPPQSVLAGQIQQLRQKLSRQRKQESRDLVARQLADAEKALAECLRKLGR